MCSSICAIEGIDCAVAALAAGAAGPVVCARATAPENSTAMAMANTVDFFMICSLPVEGNNAMRRGSCTRADMTRAGSAYSQEELQRETNEADVDGDCRWGIRAPQQRRDRCYGGLERFADKERH